MKLAAALRDGLLEARVRCGSMIYVTVEALGYVIVPKVFVDGLMRSLERGDNEARDIATGKKPKAG